jgi:hypothetical protein
MIKQEIPINKENLNELFLYDNGKLIWKKSAIEAGGFNSIGYRTISFNKKRYLVHRFIYILHYGCIDGLFIDHIDGNTKNNKIENLRAVTHQENHFNHTRAKGYSYNKKLGKYSAQIHKDGIKNHLGYFDTPDEAKNAYKKAKEFYHIIINK